jgi:dTDP-4-amino-4,6-dideoxygalactose transaminase
VAHLFGGRVDLRPIAEFTQRHGLLLIEDCAQAFWGPREMGDPLADVSMFSFGTIKTATAAGGALLRVRDPLLLARMRQTQDGWPAQTRRDYAARLLKTLCLVLVGRPFPYGLLLALCNLLGRDLDALVSGASRAFPRYANPARAAEDGLFVRIRDRPSSPLLALLARRLRTFDEDRLARRAAAGEEVARRLPATFAHPGEYALVRTHWIFPVVAPDPCRLVSILRRRGFDASRATSSITVVEAPQDLPALTPKEAARMMSDVVFLPVYPELPEEALRCLILVLQEIAGDRDDALPEVRT